MAYISNLTDMEWELIADFMAEAPRGRPRTYAGRALVNAIRYVARAGCSWRMLPVDFPPWPTVFHPYQRWTKLGLWADIATALLPLTRRQAGRDEAPKSSSSTPGPRGPPAAVTTWASTATRRSMAGSTSSQWTLRAC
jgi:transposase